MRVIKLFVTIMIFLIAYFFVNQAFALSIGGPRGFDFGEDGNLYFSQGPTSAFPSYADSFEGIASLSGSGIIAEYTSLSPGASTAPIMENDGSFYVGLAMGVTQVGHYSSTGSLQSYFWLTSSIVNPLDHNNYLGEIENLVEGPNNNLYLNLYAMKDVWGNPQGGELIQEYTKSGTFVKETFLEGANGIWLSFDLNGVLYAADRYGGTVRSFDDNFNITSTQSFSEVNDLRNFYIDIDGNYLFTSRTPDEITGIFSRYNPSTNIWNQTFIDQGIPLAIIQIPNGTNFVSGNYFVGLMEDLPDYGRVLEFDSNFGLVATFSADEPTSPGPGGGGAPVPEPTTLSLLGLGLLGSVFRRKKTSN